MRTERTRGAIVALHLGLGLLLLMCWSLLLLMSCNRTHETNGPSALKPSGTAGELSRLSQEPGPSACRPPNVVVDGDCLPFPTFGGPSQGCEVITIHRALIEVETDGLEVRMRVPVTYDLSSGEIVIWVWLPEINNGKREGPFRANEWFRFATRITGVHRYHLAVEADFDGDHHADFGLQCDRHRGTFTTELPKPDPVPVPTSGCELPNVMHSGRCLPVCGSGELSVGNLFAVLNGDCHPFCDLNPNDSSCTEPEPEPEPCEPPDDSPSDNSSAECRWNPDTCEWNCAS